MVFKEPREMTLLDDVFARVVLDRVAACQHVLRTITKNKSLTVVKVKTQFSISQIEQRGIIADVVATDDNGRNYIIEVQRLDTHDHAPRVRYYTDLLDAYNLDKGARFAELPEVYVIYISETDIWRLGKTTYTVKKIFEETGTEYKDGVHVIYVNAAVDDGSEIAVLLRYMVTCDPDDMSQGELSEAVRYYKTNEGASKMLKDYSLQLYTSGREDGRAEGKAEGQAEGKMATLLTSLRNVMANMKVSLERAMDIIGLPAEERPMYTRLLAAQA